MGATDTVKTPRVRRSPDKAIESLALRMANATGLMGQAKTEHLNAQVQPALFNAAARQIDSNFPAVVIAAALAALATQADLGPWLA